MRNTSAILFGVLLLVAVGCSSNQTLERPSIPIVHEILSDASSDIYVDFTSYPDDISSLPIGVICKFDDFDAVSSAVVNLDSFDNINGNTTPDAILDFAGEHFFFIALRDTLDGNLRDTAVFYTAKLLQEGVKMVIIASDELSDAGLGTVSHLLLQTGKNIKAIGVSDSADYVGVAAECYRILREERNLALRITPQESHLSVFPPIPPITDTVECTQQQ